MDGKVYAKTMLEAARCVKVRGMSRQQVARKYGIKYSTLAHYIRRFSDEDLYGSHPYPTLKIGKCMSNNVLTIGQEKKLIEYVMRGANIYCGLTSVQIRQMCYDLVRDECQRLPPTWHESKMAAPSWYSSFIKRHALLREKLAPTLAETGKNYAQTKVDKFFAKFEDLVKRCQFKAGNIWVMQEFGVNVKDNPNRIVVRGYSQSNHFQDLVTFAMTVCADGERGAPVCILPKSELLPDNSSSFSEPAIVKVSHWMNETNFVNYLKHFVKYTRCSGNNCSLLIIDNQSYMSIEAMNYASENGLILLSFPQFCTYKLHPLLDQDICVNFSNKLNIAVDKWKKKYPMKELNDSEIEKMVEENYKPFFLSKLVKAAFRIRGLFPMKKMVLTDIESEEVRKQTVANDKVVVAMNVDTDMEVEVIEEVNKSADVQLIKDFDVKIDMAGPSGVKIIEDLDSAMDIAGPSFSKLSGDLNSTMDMIESSCSKLSEDSNRTVNMAGSSYGNISEDLNVTVDMAGPSFSKLSEDLNLTVDMYGPSDLTEDLNKTVNMDGSSSLQTTEDLDVTVAVDSPDAIKEYEDLDVTIDEEVPAKIERIDGVDLTIEDTPPQIQETGAVLCSRIVDVEKSQCVEQIEVCVGPSRIEVIEDVNITTHTGEHADVDTDNEMDMNEDIYVFGDLDVSDDADLIEEDVDIITNEDKTTERDTTTTDQDAIADADTINDEDEVEEEEEIMEMHLSTDDESNAEDVDEEDVTPGNNVADETDSNELQGGKQVDQPVVEVIVPREI